MKRATRRKRAILRDRRRGYDNGQPLFTAMTGFDLYLLNRYSPWAAHVGWELYR